MDDPTPWLRLAHAPGLHAGCLAPWLESGAEPIALLSESPATWRALGLPAAAVAALAAPRHDRIAADVAWLAASTRRALVPWGSAHYPARLAHVADAPLVLYVEGDPAALALPQLAVVGSRNPTAVGRDTARQFAAHLATAGLAITSGLALGIDAAAHRGALAAGGITVAVVGSGLDRTYPPENATLAREIVDGGGAVVADLPTGTPPLRHHFPRRNRLLSGLSLGTLVIEAAVRSGSLITARLAGEQGREVFAVPGSIHNPMARGCHRLLRQGAKLVETVDDILQELAPILGENNRLRTASMQGATIADLPSLDKAREILLDALGFEPAALDSLVVRTGFGADAVASMLLLLELDGRIQQQPGGRYSRRLPGKV
jgi:DNA processing protein